MKPTIKTEQYEIWLGDCLDVLPHLSGVDAVVTDPPYGISADKSKAHSSIRDSSAWPKSEWDKQRPSRDCFAALISAAPSVCIWGGNYFADYLPVSSAWLIWRKPQAETGFSLSDAEMCWTNGNFSTRLKTFARRDGNQHPTQKPVCVMAWCLSFLPNAHTILDPFMGSGTTGVACIQTGRYFIGVEKEPKYFEIAAKRLADAAAQGQLFTPEPAATPEPAPLLFAE